VNNFFCLNVPELCNIQQYCTESFLAPGGDSQQGETTIIEKKPSSAPVNEPGTEVVDAPAVDQEDDDVSPHGCEFLT
jgi:hypothetical protein